MTGNEIPTGRAALIVGHPGHELRIHGWMELAQPTVFVLTDGSGGAAQKRIDSTTRLLEHASCTRGSIYGVSTDKNFYQAMMAHKIEDFLELTLQLADALEREEVDYVVGDSFEGYNPTHDMCRLMIGAATEIVRRRSGHKIRNYDFLLVGAPDDCSRSTPDKTFRLQLDEELFQRKMAAAFNYSELAAEVDTVDREFGFDSLRTECLCQVESKNGFQNEFDEAPFYERYGEQQVAAGRYLEVLRYNQHFRPLAAELWAQTAGRRFAKAS